MIKYSWFLCLSLSLYLCVALDVPCTPEKSVGEPCLFDEECFGGNAVCSGGRCSCPLNFEEFSITSKMKVCRSAPDGAGASCESRCQMPRLCRHPTSGDSAGRCECWGGTEANGTCQLNCGAGKEAYGLNCKKVSHFSDRCVKDEDCVDAFNVCHLRKCQCAPGSVPARTSTATVCLARCPDGELPRQACKRLQTNEMGLLRSLSNAADSCPTGFQCVTYGKPLIGHCCRQYCPYGVPDTKQTCDSNAPDKQRCRPLTHYCYRAEEPGWSTAICCPRPCREPTPLFMNNMCVALAHRGEPCRFDNQCEGGVTMRCEARRCACRDGFKPRNDRFPTCYKQCANSEVAVQGQCMKRAQLGERCIRCAQCPDKASCYYGRCRCRCGHIVRNLFGPATCQNPDDPFNVGGLVEKVSEIFEGGSIDGLFGGGASCNTAAHKL